MATTLGLGVAAVNTGNNLLFLIVSAMLGFMAVSGLMGWLNIRNLEVRLQVPDEVYAGVQTLVSVLIINRRRFLPSFLIRIALCGTEALCTVVERGGAQKVSFLHAFPERGLHTITCAVVGSSFPVHFFVRRRQVPVQSSVTVFPAPRSFPVATPVAPPDAGSDLTPLSPGYDGELVKISDYRGGESLKLIHWRLSAKHEVFKVKELSATADEPVIIEPELLPGRNMEDRLSHGAYLINRLLKVGRPVGLKVGEKRVAAGNTRQHRLQLLGELALYGKN
ncbi:DUF58 domain-containing protein [Geomonas sp. RF6]|uniref:DUF58 domain-containing protein n=1 Tax=Geomonas sp. RF6 TaxID=2897342 RepID=UPI001E2DF8B9|nr:DUF58 domain-containing protein [Geomonas sp. RF6]UFS70828.1 DUF58 domain-containing protein [Geomonas sp. RF6]